MNTTSAYAAFMSAFNTSTKYKKRGDFFAHQDKMAEEVEEYIEALMEKKKWENFNEEHEGGDGMSKHMTKVENLVISILQDRGFSEAEAMQIIARLQTGGNGEAPPPHTHKRRSKYEGGIHVVMPFGRYKGFAISGISDSSYLIWLNNQQWFDAEYYDLAKEVEKEITRRRKSGTL